MSTVSLMTSLNTDGRLFGVPGFFRRNTERSITDCLKTSLWHIKIRWWRRTQTLSTCKIGDMAQAVTHLRRGKAPQAPKFQYTASLKDIRCGARSQCSRWSRGMIWSYRVALNTNRAAAFITDCNRRSWYNGRPANVGLRCILKVQLRATIRWTGRRGESANDGYFSVVSVWKKQVDTVRTTWEHMLTSESKINSQVAHDCGWRYEVITHTKLWTCHSQFIYF